ncbi:MAG: ribonuclease D [Rhodobacteraceae bacterium]|nr:ribonuclease D [Paracoccaceae bacterium]
MKTLATTAALAEFCGRAARHDYVTVDTEFLRERTYYPKLCLVQLAFPGDGTDDAVLVDPLADRLDLGPLYQLFGNENVVKVFHAARQDLEIFYIDAGVLPKPFFDTQIAAMVCGYGEQAGYETLVRKVAHASLDKSSRFTDWARRPLSDMQKAYALADVTHLRVIYEKLRTRLDQSGRTSWVTEEVQALLDPDTYRSEPEDAWRRIRTRSASPRFLAYVKELAAFRESYAQAHNIPRNRVIRDDALMELATTRPKDQADLGKSRLLLREARKGDIAAGLIAAVKRAAELPDDALPKVPPAQKKPQGMDALSDLLRVLLKARADGAGVAQKLIATASDLDDVLLSDGDHPVFHGWRNEIFGKDAAALISGEIALGAEGNMVKVFRP